MDSLPLSLEDLKRLVALFDEHRLTELELREGGVRVRLHSAATRPIPAAAPPEEEDGEGEGSRRFTPEPPPVAAREPGPEEKGWTAISAPMTGNFFRKPSPEEPEFAEVGQALEPEQVIGLIEAMKIFSEIRSEVAGTLMELPVANGQMVQPGQVLAWILPL